MNTVFPFFFFFPIRQRSRSWKKKMKKVCSGTRASIEWASWLRFGHTEFFRGWNRNQCFYLWYLSHVNFTQKISKGTNRKDSSTNFPSTYSLPSIYSIHFCSLTSFFFFFPFSHLHPAPPRDSPLSTHVLFEVKIAKVSIIYLYELNCLL